MAVFSVAPWRKRPEHTPRTAFKALVPWILLCIFVFIWGYPAGKAFLNGGAAGHENFLHGISVLNVPVPGLDKAVVRTRLPHSSASLYFCKPTSSHG